MARRIDRGSGSKIVIQTARGEIEGLGAIASNDTVSYCFK